MKKVFTFFAAMTLLASAGFAQSAHRHVPMTKADRNATVAPRLHKQNTAAASIKAAGDTVSTFPWTEGFENTTVQGFTYIDNDGDGFNWERKTSSTDRFSCHSGDGVIVSASYDADSENPLNSDNWMILPAFTLPADASEFNLSWFEMGQDANYAAETYSVYISTTGRQMADFTAAALTSTATGAWVKKIVSLADYAGQTIFIAFRHQCTDMFYLNIDDIRVGGAEVPEVTVDGPASVELNTAATFTATGASTFAWTVDGEAQTETSATLAYTFTTTGNHTVVASATNSAGTGSDSVVVEVYDCSEAITAMPWFESFDGNTNCWRLLVADTIDRGFQIAASSGYDDSFCLFGNYSDDVNTNQWAISPMITLPADADNFILKYYVSMRDWEGVQSHYQVRITTVSDPDTSDFTTILVNEEGNTTGQWVPRTVSMADYAGQTIRLAFRNITPVTGDAMAFDAIYVGQPLPPDMTLAGPENAIMDEPATWTANTDVTTVEWTIDGTVDSETGLTLSHAFTTAGSHTIVATATNVAGSTSDTITVQVIDCSQLIEAPHTFDLATEYGLCWNNPQQGWDTINLDGTYHLYSMSNYNGWFDLNPDNWVFTPNITMPASGSYEIAWDVMPYAAQLPTDHYGVYLVHGGDTTLLREETLNANITAPSSRAATLPAGTTGEFKIAFRHYETTGGYVLLVSNIRVVEAGTTGIDDVENAQVAVYPNPANNMVMVEAENVNLVQVMDINGRVVLSSERAGRLDVSGLAAGVYVVRVVCADGVSTIKIVKE